MLENVSELDILHRNTTAGYGAYMVHVKGENRVTG